MNKFIPLHQFSLDKLLLQFAVPTRNDRSSSSFDTNEQTSFSSLARSWCLQIESVIESETVNDQN